jgi:hypothetical protein
VDSVGPPGLPGKAGGGLERTYDLKISHTLDGLDPSNPLPQVWELLMQWPEFR